MVAAGASEGDGSRGHDARGGRQKSAGTFGAQRRGQGEGVCRFTTAERQLRPERTANKKDGGGREKRTDESTTRENGNEAMWLCGGRGRERESEVRGRCCDEERMDGRG